MFQKRHVKISKDNEVIDGIIEFSTSEPWELRLFDKNTGKLKFSCKASDLFDCLIVLREQYLEKKKYIIQCNGARKDVYPSRMSRQMSGGLKAYSMQLGEPANAPQLLDIFDYEKDLSCLATVNEQKEFYEKWLDSL